MAILTGFLPFKNRIKTADGYKLQSLWTSSDTVECANGATLTTVLGNKADLSSGKVPITQLPPNSKTVANDTARFALTTNDVHNGFIVEVTATGNMYIVEDDTNLDSEAGYKPLSSDWDSIMNKPDNIAFLEDDDEEMPSISPVLRQSNLVNNLNAITTGSPLDAAQGKVIGDKLGNTSIAGIGNGTVTGAISTLNSTLADYIKIVTGNVALSTGFSSYIAFPTGYNANNCCVLNFDVFYSNLWRCGEGIAGASNNRLFTALDSYGIRIYNDNSGLYGADVRVVLHKYS